MTARAQLYIDVAYAQSPRAKEMGARWDAALKCWYVPYGVDINLLKEWWPKELKQQMAALADPKPGKKRAQKRSVA